jgi:protein-tyrosine phosphatase
MIGFHIRSPSPALVRCASGVERSPAVVALYLVRVKGLTPTGAYAKIRAVRPQVIEEFDLLPLTYEERVR